MTDVRIQNEIINVELSSVEGPQGPRGEPGPTGSDGATQTVSTVATFEAASFESSTKSVLILGYHAAGVGQLTVRRVSSEPSHPWKFRSVDRYLPDGTEDGTYGGWWEGVADDAVNPLQFGAYNEPSYPPTTDSSTEIQNWIEYLKTHRVPAEIIGTFGVSQPIEWNFDDGTGHSLTDRTATSTLFVNWGTAIWDISDNGLDYIIKFQYGNSQVFTGSLGLYGNAVVDDIAARKTLDGAVIENTNRVNWASLIITGGSFQRWLVNVKNQCSVNVFGTFRSSFCGPNGYFGSDKYWVYSDITNIVNDANTSLSERSTITLATPLPDWLTDANFAGQTIAAIDFGGTTGRPVYVHSIDSPTQITVWPHVDPARIGQTAYFLFGGTCRFEGSDSNINTVQSIDQNLSCIALWVACLYGPTVNRLHSEVCGAAVVLGRSPSNALPSGCVIDTYTEQLVYSVLQVTVATISFTFVTFNRDGNYNFCAMGSGYDGSTTQSPTYTIQNLSGYDISSRNGYYPDNSANQVVKYLDPFATSQSVLVTSRDSHTVNLLADPTYATMTQATACALVVTGTGDNGSAKGTYTFVPPSGWSLNGGAVDASLAYDGFVGPTLCAFTYDYGAQNIQVSANVTRGPATKTTDFTVVNTDESFICNGSGTITVTLPTPSANTGRKLRLKNKAAFTVVSASANVTQLDGATTTTAILPATPGAWVDMQSGGTNWIIMASN